MTATQAHHRTPRLPRAPSRARSRSAGRRTGSGRPPPCPWRAPLGLARSAGPRGLSPGNGRRAGFTFLELMFVLILIGILFSFALPSFEGLTPKYRLRTAARELGSKIEGHRLLAITKGVTLGIRYSMEGNETYYQLLQPPPEDYPSQPISERPAYGKAKLPAGVQILGVRIRGSDEFHSSGTILVVFSPTGTSGSHAVTLGTNDGRMWTVELNAITGMIDFRNAEDAGFKDFEG